MIFLQALAILFFLEIAAFIVIGGAIGFFPAVLLCFISAVGGSLIVQRQGLSAVGQMQASLDKGLLPMDQLFDGACLLIAGALLITPGFLSDAAAFFLLVPQMRQKLRIWIARRYGKDDGSFNPDTGVIEGDFVRVRDDADLIRPPHAP